MARYTLTIEQGTTWGRSWPLTDPGTGAAMNLTGWTVRGQVRATQDATTVLHEWNSATGNASASADGKVTITVAPAVSTAWLWRTGVYDIEATNPSTGQVVRVSEGQVNVSREITR